MAVLPLRQRHNPSHRQRRLLVVPRAAPSPRRPRSHASRVRNGKGAACRRVPSAHCVGGAWRSASCCSSCRGRGMCRRSWLSLSPALCGCFTSSRRAWWRSGVPILAARAAYQPPRQPTDPGTLPRPAVLSLWKRRRYASAVVCAILTQNKHMALGSQWQPSCF